MRSEIGRFEISAIDGNARVGTFVTTHGKFSTPAFMPVGTQGSVKGLTPAQLKQLGAEIVLANAYHLHVRPGDELIAQLGGIHRFIGWDGPILTDSGGYQVFSLAKLRKVSDEGVVFQSHVDGAIIEFTPERVVNIQENLGVDIMMVLDECPPYPISEAEAWHSWSRTAVWAKRSLQARKRQGSLLFGIVQGGMFEKLRAQACVALADLKFDGYAIGGVSVGEPIDEMRRIVRFTAELLPRDRIRYLMGVGTPEDIIFAVSCGVDLFDCVIPTRGARFGRIFVDGGYINLRNSKYRRDDQPLVAGCDCYTCANFSRAYVSHLIHAEEVLAITLATIHNVRFYERLMEDIRRAIADRRYSEFASGYITRSGLGEIFEEAQ